MPSVMSDVILEAEMVAFSDDTERIDGKSYPCSLTCTTLNYSLEFWRIRSLIESTAVGSRHKVRKMFEETPAM
jgi:DNA ligase 4